jgi:ATP-dependent Lhr-like helicase
VGADNLLAYLDEQREATGHVPDDRTIVVERFRDELGDWRVVIHSPFGAQVHAPWALAIAARLRERYGVDVQAMHADDGIVLRLPDPDGPMTGWTTRRVLRGELLDAILLDPDEVDDLVTARGRRLGAVRRPVPRVRGAGAAAAPPRSRPAQPLWQQRQRSAQLLRWPAVPVVPDRARGRARVPAGRLRRAGPRRADARDRSRTGALVEVETPQPSPFARSLLFGYVAQFLYEGDSPLAERRAAALSLDPTLLAELLGARARAARAARPGR